MKGFSDIEPVTNERFSDIEHVLNERFSDIEPVINESLSDIEHVTNERFSDIEHVLNESLSDIEPVINESLSDIEHVLNERFSDIKPGINESESENDDKKYDIGQILNGNVEIIRKKVTELDDTLKYKILCQHEVPDDYFKFPAKYLHGRNRKCQKSYIDFPFVYSKENDSVWCLPCALFVPYEKRGNLRKFVNCGFSKWHKTNEEKRNHVTNDYHGDAMLMTEGLKKRFENPTETLPFRIEKGKHERYVKYRHILKTIAKSVHYLAKQNMPLRGHREKLVFGNTNINPGNFIALLKLFSENDPILYEHLNAPMMRNATYKGYKSQNEMINVIGHKVIRADILAEIREATFHSVMADEVTSHNDQIMSICIRFVDQKKQIREEFLDFMPLERITGEHLAEKMVKFYNDVNLDLQQIRGQCYDGASNMSSRKKGLSGRILDKNYKAISTHCNSHVLNLSIAGTVKVGPIETVLEKMIAINIFFNYSPKREKLLEHVVNENEPEGKKKKILIGLCKTRWSERQKAFSYFHDAFLYIIEALEIIAGVHPDVGKYDKLYTSGWDGPSKKDALSYMKSCCEFSFIVGMVSLKILLQPLHATTVRLQGRTIDIIQAYHDVTDVISKLKYVRENVEEQFKTIFTEAERIANTLHVAASIPRTVSRQVHRSNTPASSPEEYFRTTLGIVLLDKIITEMEVRFNDFNQKSAKLLFLVPSILSNDDIDFDDEAFGETVEFYSTDIPDSLLRKQELELWKRKWGMVKDEARPHNLSQSLKECDELTFPNLFVLLKIAATLPITSCECERSFSVIRRLRTWLRACMSSDRLSALALIHIHYGHSVDYDRVVDLFLKLHPRKLDFVNLIWKE